MTQMTNIKYAISNRLLAMIPNTNEGKKSYKIEMILPLAILSLLMRRKINKRIPIISWKWWLKSSFHLMGIKSYWNKIAFGVFVCHLADKNWTGPCFWVRSLEVFDRVDLRQGVGNRFISVSFREKRTGIRDLWNMGTYTERIDLWFEPFL